MNEWLNFVRFDIIFALIAITIIVTHAFTNQRKSCRNLVCLIFAAAIVGVPLIFDYADIFTKSISFAKTTVFPIIDGFIKVSSPLLLHKMLIVIALICAVYVVEGILILLCKLIGGTDKRKYRKYPAYATPHRPVWGVIVGIIKCAAVVYVLYIILVFVGDYVGLDISKEYVVKVFRMFDPIVGKIKAILDKVLGV